MNSLDKMEDYDRLQQERDELAAHVEVMRLRVEKVRYNWDEMHSDEVDSELSAISAITPSAALREIEARVLEEAAELKPKNGFEAAALMHKGVTGFLKYRVAAKRNGE